MTDSQCAVPANQIQWLATNGLPVRQCLESVRSPVYLEISKKSRKLRVGPFR